MAVKNRGFASMPADKRQQISSKGGKASHANGGAHEWTSEEAREAGHKGGTITHQRKRDAAALTTCTIGPRRRERELSRRSDSIDKAPSPN